MPTTYFLLFITAILATKNGLAFYGIPDDASLANIELNITIKNLDCEAIIYAIDTVSVTDIDTFTAKLTALPYEFPQTFSLVIYPHFQNTFFNEAEFALSPYLQLLNIDTLYIHYAYEGWHIENSTWNQNFMKDLVSSVINAGYSVGVHVTTLESYQALFTSTWNTLSTYSLLYYTPSDTATISTVSTSYSTINGWASPKIRVVSQFARYGDVVVYKTICQ
jgi:hypothetical protein